MKVNSDDPNSQVCSGHLTTVPQCPKPSFTASCKKRYTPLRVIEFKLLNSTNSTNSYHEEECISEGFYLKGKTLKEETLKTNFTGEVGQ